jgi:hypothetical protein
MKKWTDYERDDLHNIPLAIEKGWTPDFDYKDKMHKRTTPDNPPQQDAAHFKKGVKVAWKIYVSTSTSLYSQWRVADLINGHFRNHRTYDTIEEVFDKE